MCWRDNVVQARWCSFCRQSYYGDLGHRDSLDSMFCSDSSESPPETEAARHLRRAHLAVQITKTMHPGFSDQQVEDFAGNLMHLPVGELRKMVMLWVAKDSLEPVEEDEKKPALESLFQGSNDEVDSKPKEEPIQYETLSREAQQGIENFRAFLLMPDVEIVRDGDTYIRRRGGDGSVTEIGGVCTGFMLAAGATLEDAFRGESFAWQHGCWVKPSR